MLILRGSATLHPYNTTRQLNTPTNLSATQLASCQHDAGFDLVTKSSCQPPPGCYQYLCSKRRILHITVGVQIKETRHPISLITTTLQLLLATPSPVVSCSNPSTALVTSPVSSNVLHPNSTTRSHSNLLLNLGIQKKLTAPIDRTTDYYQMNYCSEALI